MPYIGKSPGKLGVRTRYHYTATGSETSKSGPDDNGLTLKFDDGEYVDVYLNGSLLVAGSDYNTATANTISGLTALASNDILEVVVYDIYSLAKVNSEAQRTVYHKTASGGETSISGADDSGATITFPVNAVIDVYLNGVKLKQGDDYNTTTANTVGGLTALTAGQLVAITVFEKFVAADMVKKSGDTMTGGLSAPSIISTGTGTFSGDLIVDTNTLVVDTANNRVGIGDPTPADTLGVEGNLRLNTSASTTRRVYALGGEGAYSLGTSGGSAIAFHRLSNNSDEIAFETHDQGNSHFEMMRLNRHGYVTMPKQPAFCAYQTANQTTTDGQVFNFTALETNVGGHFSLSGDRFTAPVAGTYYFSFYQLTQNNTSAGDIRFRKNGAALDAGYGYGINNLSGHKQSTLNIVITLAANDYVQITSVGTTNWNDRHGNFSGFLIG